MGTDKRARQKANRARAQQEAEKAVAKRKTLRTAAIVAAAIVGLVIFVWIASNIVADGNDEPTTPDVTLVETSTPANTDG